MTPPPFETLYGMLYVCEPRAERGFASDVSAMMAVMGVSVPLHRYPPARRAAFIRGNNDPEIADLYKEALQDLQQKKDARLKLVNDNLHP